MVVGFNSCGTVDSVFLPSRTLLLLWFQANRAGLSLGDDPFYQWSFHEDL